MEDVAPELLARQGLTDETIEALVAERTQAKKQRNFARADQIRNELAEKGVVIEDSKDGCAGSGSNVHQRSIEEVDSWKRTKCRSCRNTRSTPDMKRDAAGGVDDDYSGGAGGGGHGAGPSHAYRGGSESGQGQRHLERIPGQEDSRLRYGADDRPAERLTIADKKAQNKIAKGYAGHQEKWAEDLETEKKQAEAFEEEVKLAEKKGDHYDLGEALLEIGLVITSITLLTKKRVYWYAGMSFSVIGIVATTFGLMLK